MKDFSIKIKFASFLTLVLLLFSACSKGLESSESSNEVKFTKKIPYSTAFKTKEPKANKKLSVSKLIKKDEGGELILKDPKGVEVKFYVQKDSLSEDLTITISPLEEVPIESYESTLSNGVLIEPDGLVFSKNALLTFDFSPGDKSQKNSLSEKSGVIHVDSVARRVSDAKAQRFAYGKKLVVGVKSLSSYVPDDLSGQKGEDVTMNDIQNAVADATVGNGPSSGDPCSGTFMKAALGEMANIQMASGSDPAAGDIWAMLQECGKNVVDELERKCKENPMQLRRIDFYAAMELNQLLGNNEQSKRAEQLMKDCKREYSFGAEKQVSVEQGVSIYKIEAKMCGYIDEKWQGTELSDYTLLQAHQFYNGDVTFKMPFGGGPFVMETDGTLTAQSPFTADMSFPFVGDGQVANFDGNKTVTVFYEAYGRFDVEAEIMMKDNKCETTDEELRQLE